MGESWVLSCLTVTVALAQPIVYNSLGWEGGCFMCGNSGGEIPVHFIEFSFEILSAFVSARIVYDNKVEADKRLRAFMPDCCAKHTCKHLIWSPHGDSPCGVK